VELGAATQKLERSLGAWYELGTTHASSLDDGAQAAQQAARAVPNPLQPFVHFIVARRCGWEHTKAAAPSIIDLVPHLALSVHVVLQLDTAVADFWDAEDRANTISDVEQDTLLKLH
jgi:hypothetical protein